MRRFQVSPSNQQNIRILIALNAVFLILLLPIRYLGARVVTATPPGFLDRALDPLAGQVAGSSLSATDKLNALSKSLPPGVPDPNKLSSWTFLHVGRPAIPGVAWLHCEGVESYGSPSGVSSRNPPPIATLPYIYRRDRGQSTAPFCEVSFVPPGTAQSYAVTLNICWNGFFEAPGFRALREMPPTFELTTSVDTNPVLRAINPDPRVDFGLPPGSATSLRCGAVVVPLTGVTARRQFVHISPIASDYLAVWQLISAEIDQTSSR